MSFAMIVLFGKNLLEEICLQTISNMFAKRAICGKFNEVVVPFANDKNLFFEQVFVLMYASDVIKYYGIFKVNRFSDVS